MFCFLGGNSLNNLIELKTININPTDTTVPLLSDCIEVSEAGELLLYATEKCFAARDEKHCCDY